MKRQYRSVRYLLALVLGGSAVAAAAAVWAPSAALAQEEVPAETGFPAQAEKPGWLGVSLENTDALPDGAVQARVKIVFRDSPADKAGMKTGDVVTAIDGHAITKGIKELVAHVKSHAEGSSARFDVQRGGSAERFEVVLAEVLDRKSLTDHQWKGQKLPDGLGLRDVNTDAPIELTKLRGEVLVLDIWATWCGPCRASMPHMEELQKKYADRGLRVVGISNEERDVVKRFTDNRGLAFKTLAYDPEQSIGGTLYVGSYPTYMIVDTEGTIREIYRGSASASELDAVVEGLLPH